MAGRQDRYRQAAWTYAAYGVVYWFGGLVLAAAGRGPRGMERGRWAWFVAGAVFVLVFPWLLARPWRWRRAFAAVLALLVAYRAFEVARIAVRSGGETVSVAGLAVSVSAGAWAFSLLALVTALVLARAAWGREP